MMQLPHDVAALVELAAAHAEGAQPLFEGHLESVASLYQVHPTRVEHARKAFAAPHARSLASALASQTIRCDGLKPTLGSPQKDAATLVREAKASPLTMELVMHAPMELAAVQLGAHPFVVEAARLQLLPIHHPERAS